MDLLLPTDTISKPLLTKMESNNKKDVNWQADKSLAQCTLYLMENNIADVTFKLEYNQEGAGEGKEPVYHRALRTLLIARSSVFFAMFCGDLAENDEVITVTDVEPDAFYQLLRFIYTDRVHLTANNVCFVLHAAKKYMVNTLRDQCSEYLANQLSPETACMILDQSLFFSEANLTAQCLRMIQAKPKETFASKSFLKLSSGGLKEVLNSAIFNATECEIFKACLKWAKQKCADNKLPGNSVSVRQVLGDCMLLVRFPTMTLNEFADSVIPHELLTDKEGFAVLRNFNCTQKPPSLPFSAVPRKNPFLPMDLVFDNNPQGRQLVRLNGDKFIKKQEMLGNKEFISKFKVQISDNIVLSKVYIHRPDENECLVDSETSSIKIMKCIFPVLSSSCKPVKKEASNNVPAHFEIPLDNVELKQGDFEMTITSRYRCRRGHCSYYNVTRTPSVMKLPVNQYVTMKLLSYVDHVFLGIEFRLPSKIKPTFPNRGFSLMRDN